MNMRSVETAVGIFVIISIVCVGYLAIRLGKMEWFGKDTYGIEARFISVSGLKAGAQVEMAGVEIGKVESIDLDPERKVAIVRMRIQNGVSLAEDAIASVKTAGMIGDKYVMISPGGSTDTIPPGGAIVETESAVDLEELISKYVFGEVK
jgi:phospholipid/cholesterol/gamma-HCH transport system substrate-binding protein